MIAPLTRLLLAVTLVTLAKSPGFNSNAGAAHIAKTDRATDSASSHGNEQARVTKVSAATNRSSANPSDSDKTGDVCNGSLSHPDMMSEHDMADRDMSAPGCDGADSMSIKHMGMSAHMAWSALRPRNEAD